MHSEKSKRVLAVTSAPALHHSLRFSIVLIRIIVRVFGLIPIGVVLEEPGCVVLGMQNRLKVVLMCKVEKI